MPLQYLNIYLVYNQGVNYEKIGLSFQIFKLYSQIPDRVTCFCVYFLHNCLAVLKRSLSVNLTFSRSADVAHPSLELGIMVSSIKLIIFVSY